MHYTGPVIRPPYEAGSVMLEVTVGCTHDSCTFCTYYKGNHELAIITTFPPMPPRPAPRREKVVITLMLLP
jgi:radical SAM superfamily enzyme YgiQ (UPF0313 family)